MTNCCEFVANARDDFQTSVNLDPTQYPPGYVRYLACVFCCASPDLIVGSDGIVRLSATHGVCPTMGRVESEVG